MYPFRITPALPESLRDTVLVSGQPKTSSPAIDPRETGELIESKYDANIDYVPGRDMQDIRAARQGSMEALGNVLGRNLGKLGLRTLDGASFAATAPINMLYGLATGEVDDFGSAVAAAVDNPVSTFLRKQEDWLDKQLPIYQTKAQDNSTDLTSMGFADKLLNGLAYVGSMALGTGVLTKAIPKMISMAGGAKNAGRILANAVEEGKDLNYVTSLFSDTAALTDELGRVDKLKKTGTALKENFADFYGGAIESAAEASQTKEETVRRLTEEQLKLNNGEPLSKEQQEIIEKRGNQALTANFGMNLLTTGVANKLVFHKLLNNKWSDDMVAYNKIAKSGDDYVLQETANKSGKYKKLFQKIGQSEIAKGAVVEGGQELGQFASNDFFVNLYSNPDSDSVYKVDNFFKSAISTIGNLTSKDAMESALIGGMIGAGFGGVLNRDKDAKVNENTQALINQANKVTTSNAIKELANNVKYSDAADGALLNGDRVTYETLKASQIFDLVNSRDNIGKFGDIKSELEEAKSLKLDVFKEKYDIKDNDYTEAKRDQFINYINDIATKTKDAKTRLMSNYGHKLTELEKENPDITGFLTMIDVLKEDYTKREGDLFNKLAPYMKYDEMIANRLTPDKLQDFQQQIQVLQEQANNIQAEPANTAEALITRTDKLKNVVNQINNFQNSIANSATEANYKDFLKIEGLDEEKTIKKVKEQTRYAEYTKDLNDFKTIQGLKEQVIDYYSKIVNDVDYAKNVQKQINLANQSTLLDGIFSLNLNIQAKPRVDSESVPVTSFTGEQLNDYSFTQPEAGGKGQVQDYIKSGDIYQLYRKQVTKSGGNWKDVDTYAPYEIVGTSVDIINNIPIGKVELKGQRGDKLIMNVNQFKNSIRPFVGSNGQPKYKYDQEAENVRIYKMFKDRAIKYNINGVEVIGMLGFSGSTTGGAKSYNPITAEDLVLKYYDENGKLKNEIFKTAQWGKDFQKGYIKVLSEKETLAYQLNENAKGYMNFLLKNIESKTKSLGTTGKRVQDLQSRLGNAQTNNNVSEINGIVNMIDKYSKIINKTQEELEIKQAAYDRLNSLKPIDLVKSDELGEDFNKIVDQITEYTDAAKKLSENRDAEGRTPKQIKEDKVSKAFQIEIDGEQKSIGIINEELDKLKQEFIDQVVAEIDATQGAAITNPDLNPTLDLQYVDALRYVEDVEENLPIIDLANNINRTQGLINAASDRIKEEVQGLEQDYTRQILNETNLDINDIKLLKTAEIAAIMKFISFINRRNLYPVKEGKYKRTVEETEYKLANKDDNFITKRPSFRVKTTGNSENTDALTKKEFYRNIQTLSPSKHKVRVAKQSEYGTLGLTGDDNAIFLVVTDINGQDIVENNNKLVTTLPLNTTRDTFGFRFNDFESIQGITSETKKQIGIAFDTALSTVGNNSPKRFTRTDLERTSTGSAISKAGNTVLDQDILINQLKVGDKIKWFNEKERSGTWDGNIIRNTEDLPVGILGILINPTNWIEIESNNNDVYKTIDTLSESLKQQYPTEVSFIDDLKSQVIDLQSLRDKIIANRDSNITISIIGKSNGIPLFSDTQTSEKAFTEGGEIIVADSDTYSSAGNSYNTKSGRAYFEDADTATFFPIIVDNIGAKNIHINGKNTGISFVDNIINGGKFLQSSLTDQAYGLDNKIVAVSDAQVSVNNMLSLITYTNKNIDKPDSLFEYGIEDNQVVFYIGSTTPLRLDGEEATIRNLLANKIFNIDRKSLKNESVRFNFYKPEGEGFKNNISPPISYQEFIKDNFGIKTNIVPNKDESLYMNGYLVLDKNPIISKEAVVNVATDTTIPTSITGGLMGKLRNVANEDTTGEVPNFAGTAVPTFGAIETRSDGTTSVDSILGNTGKTTRRKLSVSFYKGNSSNLMSDSQLIAARDKFRNKYGVAFDVVKGLIDNDAFGLVSEYGEVLLSDMAPVGTDYHEEFHVVSQHILGTDQLKDLYSEWRSKNDPNATDDQVEEELAEGFRLHAMGYEGFTGKIKAVFDYLINEIRKLINLRSKINEVYNDIYYGQYYGRTTYQGTKAYKSSNGLSFDTRQKAFKGSTRQFVNDLIHSFGKNVLFTDVPDGAPLSSAQFQESFNLLATDKDARIDYLNYVEEDGSSFLEEMVVDSLRGYLNNVQDITTAQVKSYLTKENKDDFISEYTQFISKELNFKGLDQVDIDEDTTGRDIVKKGDNENDFFGDAVTQMRLFAYTQTGLDGVYPLNPDTITKLLIDNLVDSPDSTTFEARLKNLPYDESVIRNYGEPYVNAIRTLNQIIGDTNRTKAQQFMFGNLWSSFGKVSTNFKILKVTDSPETVGLDYRWVDASFEQSISDATRDITGSIKDNYSETKKLIQSTSKTSKGLPIVDNFKEVFENLFGIPFAKFDQTYPNNVRNIVNSFARSKNIDDYLKTFNSDVRLVGEYVSGTNPEKNHAFYNAGNKLQYALANPSSLFYRIRDVNKNSEILTLDKPVVINGIQKSLERDNNNRTSSDLTEDDLHIIFFNSMLPKNKVGSKAIIPFIFSGDKSTLTGIEITPKSKLLFSNSLKSSSITGGNKYSINHSEIYTEYLNDEIEDLARIIEVNKSNPEAGQYKIGKNGVKEQLPFFSFLSKTNSRLYTDIITSVKDAKKNDLSLDLVTSQYREEVLEETQNYFESKGQEVKRLFDKIGYDYKSTLNKNSSISEDLQDAYFTWYASAYAVGVQEQTKLVSSLAFYDEPGKRLPAWNGTKRPIRTDAKWVADYNRMYNSNINIGNLRALVLNDVDTQDDIVAEGIYTENNPADAQAYISLDAARFILFSSGGQTYNYRLDDLFREVETLDKKTNITGNDLDNLNNMVQEINEYINVLKPQYYGMQQVNGLDVPTFYKFSVLPLSKAITNGRNLDDIRKVMNDNNVHLVMFDSANKVGRKYNPNMNLYDAKGNYRFNQISSQEIDNSVQTSSWEGLGIQVDMPKPHSNVTFGTQMRKIITADLDPNVEYFEFEGEKLNGTGIRSKLDEIVIEKLVKDKDSLMKRLGLTKDLIVTPGKIEGVRKELIRQAISRDFSNQFIDSIRKLTTYDFVSNKSKMQQLVNSIVSKGVIKQKMNGDAKAMVSSVLFEKKGDGVQFDKRLKFYKKGVRSYMEVILPNSMKNQYADYIEYNEKEKLFTFKANVPEEIKKLVGYRIPTQSPASIENIRIKGFSSDIYGNAVVVPFELTSKAGSDFDIDKLNLFFPTFNYTVSDKELTNLLDKLPEQYFAGQQLSKLDYYKVLEETLAEDLDPTDLVILKYIKENAKGKYNYFKTNVDNRLINLFTGLMDSPAYFDNFVTTIDTKDFKILAKEIGKKRGLAKSLEDQRNSANFYDPIYAAKNRSSIMNAKDTLGAVALATTHHAESQKHGLAFNSSTIENGKFARVVKGEDTNATLGDLLSLFEPEILVGGKIRLDRINNFENKKISDILSQLVTASVDTLKDDYITSANLDLETIGVASLMIRAGIPINKVFNFISQPGVIEYTEALRKTKVVALSAMDKSSVKDRYNSGNYLKLSTKNIETLEQNITNSVVLDEEQNNFIDLYKNLEAYAQVLTDLQQVTNFDTKATGSMLEENEINLFKYDQFESKYSRLFDKTGITSMFNDQTSFTARMREEARNANNFNNSLFRLGDLYSGELLPEMKNKLDFLFKQKTKNSDKANKAFRFKQYFNSYLLQKLALSNDPSLSTVVGRTIAAVKAFQGDNPFIKRLRTGDGKLFIHSGASVQVDEANSLGEAFTEIYRTDKQLAQNIIYSGLYQFGLVNNPSTIMNIIPTSLVLDTLKLTSNDPITEAYGKVLKMDGNLNRAVENAWEHAKQGKGSNHFSNYVIDRPKLIFTEYTNLAEENPSDC